MNKKDFYGIRLNNYFSPSSCSNHKMYFGTLNDIKAFIESMGSDEQSFRIRNAFERYLSGETNAMHEVAYVQQKLIENVEGGLVFSKDGDCIWECSNCGHIVVGKKAPEVCPVCAHPKAYFQIKAYNY